MSTLKADTVTSQSTNGDLTISGNGTGVPNLEAGFKVGGSAGVPTASIQASAVTTAKINDDAVTLAKLAAGTDGELITWDASGDPAAVAVGTATHVLTSNGAGAAPTFQAAAGGGFTLGTAQATTSGTSFTFTGIPSGTTMVILTFYSISMTSTAAFDVTIGDAGGLETSGYNANSIHIDNNVAAGVGNASAFLMKNHNAGRHYSGSMILSLQDSSSHKWVCSCVFGGANGAGDAAGFSGGSKTLSAELTQISLSGGTYDDGACNIMYQ